MSSSDSALRGRYTLRLGDSFDPRPKTSFSTFRYDFLPASVDQSKPGLVEIGATDDVTVSLAHGTSSSSLSHTIFKGHKRPCQKDAVLILDRASGEACLERLSLSVQLKKARIEVCQLDLVEKKLGLKPGSVSGAVSSSGSVAANELAMLPTASKKMSGKPQSSQAQLVATKSQQQQPLKSLSASSSATSSYSSKKPDRDAISSQETRGTTKETDKHQKKKWKPQELDTDAEAEAVARREKERKRERELELEKEKLAKKKREELQMQSKKSSSKSSSSAKDSHHHHKKQQPVPAPPPPPPPASLNLKKPASPSSVSSTSDSSSSSELSSDSESEAAVPAPVAAPQAAPAMFVTQRDLVANASNADSDSNSSDSSDFVKVPDEPLGQLQQQTKVPLSSNDAGLRQLEEDLQLSESGSDSD